MAAPRIDRRHFLALGVGAAAWACGKAAPKKTAKSGKYSIVVTGQPGLAVGDTRQAFAVFDEDQIPIKATGVEARLLGPDGKQIAVHAKKTSIERGPGGEGHQHAEDTQVADVWVMRHRFDKPGVWQVGVLFNEGKANAAAFQIFDKAPFPIVGDKALASESPTTDDHRGVDPICTRDPVCSMHDITIAGALDKGKPSVLVFATPAFCTSRTCGPVVDIVEDAKTRYGKDVSFVHIEEWKDNKQAPTKGELAPTFAEWKLDTEPWIYFVGADGVVKDRWLGACGRAELAAAVKALI